MPTLTVTEPSETSQRYEISPNRETVLMGRSSKSDVCISCPSVSGTHAKIRKLGDGYVLRDLGSTNGTKLDGKRVSEIQLKRGQRIQLGDVKLVFEPDFAEDDRSDTQKIDREPLPEIETKSGSKPASRPGAKSGPEAEAEAQDNPVTTGLALLGGGLIVIGLLALIGVEAIKAIPDRGSFALFSGGILIGSGLLCFVGILFANGTIRVPRLVLQYNEDDENEEESDRKKRRKKQKAKKEKAAKEREEDDETNSSKDKSDEESEDEEDEDDVELGKAPKEQ